MEAARQRPRTAPGSTPKATPPPPLPVPSESLDAHNFWSGAECFQQPKGTLCHSSSLSGSHEMNVLLKLIDLQSVTADVWIWADAVLAIGRKAEASLLLAEIGREMVSSSSLSSDSLDEDWLMKITCPGARHRYSRNVRSRKGCSMGVFSLSRPDEPKQQPRAQRVAITWLDIR
uniref:Uncharacterized protein n=1 Tax=Sphaerodactylus townsendi TaxID=933632 RepID=A0ACB8GEP4_9SAUR